MTQVVNHPRYTPIGVAVLSMIKPEAPVDAPEAPDLFNAELRAIAAAFDSLSALPVAAAGGASQIALQWNARYVLVDLSAAINSDGAVEVFLPEGPGIGDPPCIIEVQKSGYHTAGSHLETAVVISTTDVDQSLINGVVPDNVTGYNRVALYNPGDRAVCRYLGPVVGWRTFLLLGTVVNPNVPFTAPARAAFPGPWQKSILTSGAVYPLDGITMPGQWFAMTSVGGIITLGDSSYTFNGAPGPFVISDVYVEHLFTLTDVKTFEVA
jgi:hypothetical protein